MINGSLKIQIILDRSVFFFRIKASFLCKVTPFEKTTRNQPPNPHRMGGQDAVPIKHYPTIN